MLRILAIVMVAITLAACDIVSTVTQGFAEARAVETDLEQSVGMKPSVGFSWNNTQLVSVTVSFPRIPEGKSLRELADAARASVAKQFKQTPNNIVLAFSLGKG
jgi:hypothetical protein